MFNTHVCVHMCLGKTESEKSFNEAQEIWQCFKSDPGFHPKIKKFT